MENVILALTNFSAVFAIHAYALRGDYLRAAAIFFAAAASFVYHLIECHKHAMPGIGCCTTKRDHILSINIARFFAFVAVFVCGWNAHFHELFATNYMYIILAIIGITMSEQVSDYFEPPTQRWIHVIFHSLWHISVFTTAYKFALV